MVRPQYKRHSIHGSGDEMDIVLASGYAYLDAVDRLIREDPENEGRPGLKPMPERATLDVVRVRT